MAYTFRAATSTTPGSGTTLTVTKPAGVVDGDLLVAVGYTEGAWSSGGAGWNSSSDIEVSNTGGTFLVKVWWKIAASEPANWTWTSTSAWRGVSCAAYSGALGTGTSRVDKFSSNAGDGITAINQTAPSVTPSVDGDLVVYAYGNLNGTAVTACVGFCTNVRVDPGGVCIADAVQGTAAATGTTRPSAGPGTEDFAALHVAFFLDTGSAGGTDLSVGAGALGEPVIGGSTF